MPKEVSGQLSGVWGSRPRLHFLSVHTMPHAITRSPIIEIRAMKMKLKSQLPEAERQRVEKKSVLRFTYALLLASHSHYNMLASEWWWLVGLLWLNKLGSPRHWTPELTGFVDS